MNSKFLIYDMVVVLSVVAVITVNGAKSGLGKKEGMAFAGCMEQGISTVNETGTARGMVIAKVQDAVQECGTSMGLSMFMNKSSSNSGEPNIKEMKQAKKEDKEKHLCLMECTLKKLELISTDGTSLNKTALLNYVQYFMLADLQEKYAAAFDSCLTDTKISLTGITMGKKCEGLQPFIKCLGKAAKQVCPAIGSDMMDPSGSPPGKPMDDDDDSDDEDDDKK